MNKDNIIKEIISQMSIKEKLGQLSQVMFNSENFDEVAEYIKNRSVGSIILANSSQAGNDGQEKGNIDAVNALQKLAMENGGIPIIYGRDVIHGHRIVYPIPLAMAASFNPELVEKCYNEIADEAKNDGINWSFAPMADISRDARWGRCIEGSGEDPYLGGKMARAAVKGFQDKGVAACVKHFIGYGAAEAGKDYNTVEIGEFSLRNFYLPAFKECIKENVATVMTSFNNISGEPVSSSKRLLTDILKTELGFDGFIVSDWGSVGLLKPFGVAEDDKDCARLAFDAGIDMEMVTRTYVNHIEELIENGEISEERLNEAVYRILSIKFDYGLFEKPYAQVNEIDYSVHKATAVKMAEESIVLLKNKNNILPLKKTEKIIATGPMIDNTRDLLGSWTLDFDIDYVDSFSDVLTKYNIKIADYKLQESTLLVAKDADTVIVFLGEPASITGESRSVADIEVPKYQLDLVKTVYNTGAKVIAVMSYGRPRALENIEPYCNAILYAWHTGTGAAEAIVNTLFGNNIPSGALPMTLPRCTGQIPIYYNSSRSAINQNVYYEESSKSYVGAKSMPMYPFGYGLSYTIFEYKNIRLEKNVGYDELINGEKVKICVDVKNTGTYNAKAVVQCYLKDEIAAISRPLRELKGFKKEFIKINETRTVSFELGMDELGYYGANGKFHIDKGEFTLYIGDSSYEDLSLKFELK